MGEREAWNGARFDPADAGGHYESWFQRANHPTRREAFWIRYTVFSPAGRPEDAVGELWAVVWRGDDLVAVKEVHPALGAHFDPRRLDVRIARSTLRGEGEGGALAGEAGSGGHSIGWDLAFRGDAPPLLLLPERLYAAPFPKAKALVGTPLARYDGRLEVDGAPLEVDGWIGSQNHNWGSKHTDEYAWGQVAGFDGDPSAFLELSTARVKLGPAKTPWLTPLVLRLGERELRFSALWRAARNRGAYDIDAFRWEFAARSAEARVEGRIEAPRESFVGLPYDDPPGGRKTCLNSKVGRCTLRLELDGVARTLESARRAAFEILTTRDDHGVPVLPV